MKTQAELTEALRAAWEQKKRVTTFIEVVLNQELGEPFRRDAMKKPVVVAGIKREDMRPAAGGLGLGYVCFGSAASASLPGRAGPMRP